MSDFAYQLLLAAPGGGVDEGAQQLRRHLVQLGVQVLARVVQKGADLGVIYHAHQGHPPDGGEDEGVQAHG